MSWSEPSFTFRSASHTKNVIGCIKYKTDRSTNLSYRTKKLVSRNFVKNSKKINVLHLHIRYRSPNQVKWNLTEMQFQSNWDRCYSSSRRVQCTKFCRSGTPIPISKGIVSVSVCWGVRRARRCCGGITCGAGPCVLTVLGTLSGVGNNEYPIISVQVYTAPSFSDIQIYFHVKKHKLQI